MQIHLQNRIYEEGYYNINSRIIIVRKTELYKYVTSHNLRER